MDPLVVVDAVAECMAYEEKELCKIGNIAILIMVKVAGKRLLVLAFKKAGKGFDDVKFSGLR